MIEWLLDSGPRVMAVVLAFWCAGVLIGRARYLRHWNERTRDVWFRDLTICGVVIIAVPAVLVDSDALVEVRGVLILAAMLVMFRVQMKEYDSNWVNTRYRGVGNPNQDLRRDS